MVEQGTEPPSRCYLPSGSEAFLKRLFEPLGHAVDAARHPRRAIFPDWGEVAGLALNDAPPPDGDASIGSM
jgi:hemolysin-activating ACP:hemolysin acyltransferase